MDDTVAGQRLKTLHGEIAQLTTRAQDLADTIGIQTAAPPPSVIENLQAYLADAIARGTPAERKAAIEALVAEVRITDEGLIPVFRVPSSSQSIPGETTSAATTEPAVRAMLRSVGRLGLEPRTHGLKVRCSTIELTPRGNDGNRRRSKRIESRRRRGAPHPRSCPAYLSSSPRNTCQ